MSPLAPISSFSSPPLELPLSPPLAGTHLNSPPSPEGIRHAAQQFESFFASLLIQQLRQTESGEQLFPGDNSDILGGLFDTYLGQHIARSGGLGLARNLETSLNHLRSTP